MFSDAKTIKPSDGKVIWPVDARQLPHVNLPGILAVVGKEDVVTKARDLVLGLCRYHSTVNVSYFTRRLTSVHPVGFETACFCLSMGSHGVGSNIEHVREQIIKILLENQAELKLQIKVMALEVV